MRRLLIAACFCVLSLTACGLSDEEKSKYTKQMKYANDSSKAALEASEEFLTLEGQALSAGYVGSGSLDFATEYSDKSLAWRKYENCLKGYMESNEKFVIAKTNCTAESGIPR